MFRIITEVPSLRSKSEMQLLPLNMEICQRRLFGHEVALRFDASDRIKK
jgi:hypothetical protein